MDMGGGGVHWVVCSCVLVAAMFCRPGPKWIALGGTRGGAARFHVQRPGPALCLWFIETVYYSTAINLGVDYYTNITLNELKSTITNRKAETLWRNHKAETSYGTSGHRCRRQSKTCDSNHRTPSHIRLCPATLTDGPRSPEGSHWPVPMCNPFSSVSNAAHSYWFPKGQSAAKGGFVVSDCQHTTAIKPESCGRVEKDVRRLMVVSQRCTQGESPTRTMRAPFAEAPSPATRGPGGGRDVVDRCTADSLRLCGGWRIVTVLAVE